MPMLKTRNISAWLMGPLLWSQEKIRGTGQVSVWMTARQLGGRVIYPPLSRQPDAVGEPVAFWQPVLDDEWSFDSGLARR